MVNRWNAEGWEGVWACTKTQRRIMPRIAWRDVFWTRKLSRSVFAAKLALTKPTGMPLKTSYLKSISTHATSPIRMEIITHILQSLRPHATRAMEDPVKHLQTRCQWFSPSDIARTDLTFISECLRKLPVFRFINWDIENWLGTPASLDSFSSAV